MAEKQKQSGLYRNWVSYAGGLTALAGVFLLVLAILLELSVKQTSPYTGIFTYLLFPMLIVVGILGVLLGMRLESKRRRRLGTTDVLPYPAIDLNDPAQRRRFTIMGAVGTVLFIVLSYSGYNGFLLTESVGFCGKTCHTQMGPEMAAYEHSPHARVRCVECHVGSGADWYVHSKVNGVRQLAGVITGSYDKPIPTPIKGLRPARETCEECHWSEKSWGSQLYQRPHFRYDENSTPEQISMLIKTGGGGEAGAGIHWHMALENAVTFVTEDDKLQEIPWVQVKRRDGSTTDYYRTERRVDDSTLATLAKRTMDCMDCHNRPAHTFEAPDLAVDRALHANTISQTLPFVKSLSVDTLAKEYPTRDAAHEGMRKDVLAFYRDKYPEIAEARAADIDKLALALIAIYDRNVFPEMKVSWRTYPSNIGHRNSPGCFRCHDGKHTSADGRTISSECKTCHTDPQRGPQSGMGEAMTVTEKDWHPWVTPQKHLEVEQHSKIQCYECHVAGRRPKTECNECHSH